MPPAAPRPAHPAMHLRDDYPMEDTVKACLAWAAAYSIYAVVLRHVFRRLGLRLSDAAKKAGTKEDAFCCEAAQCMVAITSHILLGPLALVLAARYCLGPGEIGLGSTFDDNPDAWLRRMDRLSLMCGEVFAGNMMYQLLFWLLRWETGVDTLMHHIGFLIASVLVLTATAFNQLAMSAISMEVSSPFLSLHVLFRQLDGSRCARISDLAAMAFSVVFVVVRIVFYGWNVAHFLCIVWSRRGQLFHPEVKVFAPGVAHTVAILVVFTAGWVLQLFWMQRVISKALKLRRRGVKES